MDMDIERWEDVINYQKSDLHQGLLRGENNRSFLAVVKRDRQKENKTKRWESVFACIRFNRGCTDITDAAPPSTAET